MIELKCWNLCIPIGAETIPTNKLNAGYQDPFFIRLPGGALRFRAPSSGEGIKSTKHSTFPRSELRETLPDGSVKQANWKAKDAPLHSLTADLSVDELPKSGKAIIGQIHGDSDHPPLKIQITGDTIYAQLRRKLNGSEDKIPLLKGYKLGQRVGYHFEISQEGKAKFFINGKQVINDLLPEGGYQFDMASYAKDTWYFKAGIYSQEHVGGVGQGVATFYALDMYHGPAKASTPSPVEQPPVSQPGKRTIATLGAEVDALLSKFKAGGITSQDALAAVQKLKVEADTDFPKTDERADFYTHVTQAKEAIKSTTAPAPAPSLKDQINSTFDKWKAGNLTAYDALVMMNAYSKRVADIPTSSERAPYYDLINELKLKINGAK